VKTIEVSQSDDSLAECARAAAREPLVLTDGGVPIAALVSIDDVDLESLALGADPEFLALIEQARAQHEAGLGLSTEEVRRELGIP
jgi:antitoxin (DNA-binding transcriptional repressor) of toxin-antitoxin stability system